MPSAWHRDDDREYSDPPLVLACDTPGCPGTVYRAAEDWHDNDAFYCNTCVRVVIHAPHPVNDWEEAYADVMKWEAAYADAGADDCTLADEGSLDYFNRYIAGDR
jgi:hypothetical protein